MFLTPKDPSKQGIILEFKISKTIKALSKTAQLALDQISQKHYTDAFPGPILCIGMAFCKKEMAHTSRLVPASNICL
jgi:hypothetical protein